MALGSGGRQDSRPFVLRLMMGGVLLARVVFPHNERRCHGGCLAMRWDPSALIPNRISGTEAGRGCGHLQRSHASRRRKNVGFRWYPTSPFRVVGVRNEAKLRGIAGCGHWDCKVARGTRPLVSGGRPALDRPPLADRVRCLTVPMEPDSVELRCVRGRQLARHFGRRRNSRWPIFAEPSE
jgi:hypothetical protein